MSDKPDEWAKFMAWRDDYSRHSDPCAWPAWQAALAAQAEAHAAELAEAREQLSAHDAIRAQLEAERDALRADAERYRWLRKYRVDSYLAAGQLSDLDVAIDAAIYAAARTGSKP